MLLDKGYFDYDFERTEAVAPIVNWEDTIKSDEEVADMLAMFGFGPKFKKPKDLEELQQYIMKEESYNE